MDGSPIAPTTPPLSPFEQRRASARHAIQDAILNIVWVAGLPSAPLLDLALVGYAQYSMLDKICTLYDVRRPGRRALVRLVAGFGGVAAALTQIGVSSARAVPVLGTLGGSAVLLTTSAATTYAIGTAFIRHLEAGGGVSADEFRPDPAELRSLYREGLIVARQSLLPSGRRGDPASPWRRRRGRAAI